MSVCGIHERGASGVGGPRCPACATMVRLAGELATDTWVRGREGGLASKKANKARGNVSPWRKGRAKAERALVPVRDEQ